ncbi:Fe-S oxidoreductase [Bacillus sp. FJAT-27225]|uniref:YkgJ family cysteine cluster protein n=1 Tax=Bacillus sp. FJAT-27225 TaxID=1743144 RepID=UPI00080C2EC1|nr:YkgJ family cysteine cluster protein [Bacillus sp. FJAT-27225]OCA87999.1 Fe-S oxidoreductase [Bacillus sp. FJAT-27225]
MVQTLPCEGCRGLCCGPVPVTEKELKRIKKRIKRMPAKMRLSLQTQQRFTGTCIFYDQENDRCGIHADRPEICRKFGYYQGLVCFRQPELAVKKLQLSDDEPVGVLSIDFKWDYFI